ncbi:unnamed protein product [Linum tenue]|uniref:F-box domain-containing protein n=1 Tax=Linum tenue TaxID=586396 RepID=A0AAV0ITY4_9ROSI|nr:unnamed protein product [Linum tenue]
MNEEDESSSRKVDDFIATALFWWRRSCCRSRRVGLGIPAVGLVVTRLELESVEEGSIGDVIVTIGINIPVRPRPWLRIIMILGEVRSSRRRRGGGAGLEGSLASQRPIRSACRSKLVCKRWNSLISHIGFNRHFVSHHRSRNDGQPPLLLCKDDQLPSLLSFLPVPDEFRSSFVVWDSFKDLILCVFQNSVWDYNHERGRSLLICNPFTKQWVALPLEPETPGYRSYETKEAELICRRVRNVNSLDLGDGQVFSFDVLVARFSADCDSLLVVSFLGGVPPSPGHGDQLRSAVVFNSVSCGDEYVVTTRGPVTDRRVACVIGDVDEPPESFAATSSFPSAKHPCAS